MNKNESIIKYSIVGIVAILGIAFLYNYSQNLGESNFTREMNKFNQSQPK